MLSDLLNTNTIQVKDGLNYNWEDAMRVAAQPLVDIKSIEAGYVHSIIEVVKKDGPYINIGPQIALAHARPDNNVHKIGLSLLKTKTVVDLVSKDHPVKLWFVLAATDSNSHLQVIKQLMAVLTNEQVLQALLNADTVTDILGILNSVSETDDN